jgi:hypothetical protein
VQLKGNKRGLGTRLKPLWLLVCESAYLDVASVFRIRFLLLFATAISRRFVIIRNAIWFVKAIWLDFGSNFVGFLPGWKSF